MFVDPWMVINPEEVYTQHEEDSNIGGDKSQKQ